MANATRIKKKAAKKATTVKSGPRKTTKKAAVKKAAPKKGIAAKKSAPKKWSRQVTETSNAMDLEGNIFTSKDPMKIAESVKNSAEKSKRKKAGSFQSAMSMINFYENRAGKNLSASQTKVLDKSKEALRKLYGKDPQ